MFQFGLDHLAVSVHEASKQTKFNVLSLGLNSSVISRQRMNKWRKEYAELKNEIGTSEEKTFWSLFLTL